MCRRPIVLQRPVLLSERLPRLLLRWHRRFARDRRNRRRQLRCGDLQRGSGVLQQSILLSERLPRVLPRRLRRFARDGRNRRRQLRCGDLRRGSVVLQRPVLLSERLPRLLLRRLRWIAGHRRHGGRFLQRRRVRHGSALLQEPVLLPEWLPRVLPALRGGSARRRTQAQGLGMAAQRGHLQTPAWHVLFPTHTLPHVPQLFLSVEVSMQTVPLPGHSLVPALHTHVPTEHILSAAHAIPQPLQLVFVPKVVHTPAHSASVDAHLHVPA